ncbi:MAG: SUMF1/EgtB/PvdO family nonheme iron enzyme [Myxococcales bacterium]|nr:SUMF1/EgtB/PvdO family nonheme iron enzyme [Myxococcales bacterium]MCB9704650.1 SUMF1/EgtB/PvdO family nonheme iron enzyme [Myxococcales bacterium]
MVRRRAPLALAALLASAPGGPLACGQRNLASALAPATDLAPATGQARCGVIKSHERPLIIEWPAADRGALESQIRRGDRLVVVRYEGCEMEILRRCEASGRYGFTALERKDDEAIMRSADDLYAKIPLGAARLEAELERHGALRLAMTIVGAYEAEGVDLDPGALRGRCEGATHLVTSLSVGAFALSSESGAGIKAGAEVASLGEGPGGGLRSSSERGFHRSDGDLEACGGWGSDGPPSRCGALLRVEVEALGATPPAPEAPTGAAEKTCPKGTVRIEGGIYTPAEQSGRLFGGNVSVADLCVAPTEVTVAEYRRCVRDGACSPAPLSAQAEELDDDARAAESALCNGGRRGHGRHPVNCVDWHQAESYCRAQGGRLPREEEWEWIARGGDQHRSYPWGEDDPEADLANACGRECSREERLFVGRDGHQGTAPVGSYRRGRGRWRLEDLAGNVWEWTASGEGSARAVRGGSFRSSDDGELRVGGREELRVRDRRADVGIRCVWEPAAAP